MLKDRQEGLVFLHGCALALASIAVFAGWAVIVEAMGWIRFVKSANLSLYLLGVVGAAVWNYHGLHLCRNRLGNLGWWESARVTRHQITRLVVWLFTLAFLTKDIEVSRAFLLGYIGIVTVLFWWANVVFPGLIVRLFFRSTVMRTALVAAPDEVIDVAEWMRSRQHFGIDVVGWVGDEAEIHDETLPRLGGVADLSRILEEHDISQVVVSQLRFNSEEGRRIAEQAEEFGCRVRFYSNAQHYFRAQPISIEHEGEYTFVTLTEEPLDNPVNRMLKRLLDMAVSVPVVLFVLPPLTLIVWLVQRREAPGPIFHRQLRTGWNRRKFVIYKFRTMYVEAEASLTQQARRHDSRVYPFGRFLRRTSLDEIPQFLNVLWGDMSVSGPRPHLIEHDEQFAKVVNSYYTRHFVKPGITGLAQSKGFRGEISELSLLRKRLGYDMMYIRGWTMLMDLRILAETVRQVLFPPRSAY